VVGAIGDDDDLSSAANGLGGSQYGDPLDPSLATDEAFARIACLITGSFKGAGRFVLVLLSAFTADRHKFPITQESQIENVHHHTKNALQTPDFRN
jgi:hypothetical protein